MDHGEELAVQAMESAKSAHHRLDKLEIDVRDVHTLAEAMAATQKEVAGMKEDIGEIKTSVSALTARPGQWWDKLLMALLGACASGLVAMIFDKLH
ncbi:hypothetical protein [Caproicibacterium sp. XB1]|uniref:hypothetical protein n=1 Tax=Caproicibacterium sp. XB1 TaxID=3396405 RepID=UPI0039B6F578